MASSPIARHPRAVRVGLSLAVALAVRWPCPAARVGLAERTDRLGQCHRVADTGAGGHAGQLCIWTDARVTACREPRGLSRPMRCPSGVCYTLSLCGVRKRRRRAACAFSCASRVAHLLDADGDDRPAGLQVVIGSICPIARRTSPTGRCPWRFRSRNPAAVRRASHRESSGRLLERAFIATILSSRFYWR